MTSETQSPVTLGHLFRLSGITSFLTSNLISYMRRYSRARVFTASNEWHLVHVYKGFWSYRLHTVQNMYSIGRS